MESHAASSKLDDPFADWMPVRNWLEPEHPLLNIKSNQNLDCGAEITGISLVRIRDGKDMLRRNIFQRLLDRIFGPKPWDHQVKK